jgi:RimJ/RimL family protein N-acetyltransferase
VLGVGGCAMRGVVWNLYYRLHPAAQGHGYATELATAAVAAATVTRPELPVVVYLVEHNTGSRRVVERLGFDLVWTGPDAGNPDPDARRLVYADRALDAATLAVVTG